MENILQFITNHWILVTAFFGALIALFVLFIVETCSGGLDSKNRLTPFQVSRLINSEKAIVVDIRDENTYSKGHITNAINIPLVEAELDKNKRLEQYKHRPLIIVCAVGRKSGYLIKKLHQQGYEKVYFLKGGMAVWINANMPVVK